MENPTLGDLFRGFRRTAFRYETLTAYSVDEETEYLDMYLRGIPLPPSTENDWTQLVRRETEAGKSFTRVRLVPQPVGSYFRFELEWFYPYSALAGENILMLKLESGEPSPLAEDFWLFDGEHVAVMNYDQNGRFLGTRYVGGDDAASYVSISERIKANAAPMEEFLAKYRIES